MNQSIDRSIDPSVSKPTDQSQTDSAFYLPQEVKWVLALKQWMFSCQFIWICGLGDRTLAMAEQW